MLINNIVELPENPTRKTKVSSRIPITLLGLVLLAFLPLLKLSNFFYDDWINHLWVTQYFTLYFKSHFIFPSVLNTTDIVGLPQPIFYGSLFYPLVASLSSIIGPNLGLRLMLLIVALIEAILIYEYAHKKSASAFLSIVISSGAVLSTYQLTNLYNRNAIPEYFAICSLTCAIICLFNFFDQERPGSRWIAGFSLFFFVVLAAGAHPITAFYGSATLAIIAAVTAFATEYPVRNFKRLVPFLIVAILTLTPFLIALYRFGSHLMIRLTQEELYFFKSTFEADTLISRFSPIPLQWREIGTPLDKLDTPFLDAQFSYPLLFIYGTCLIQCWKEEASRRLRVFMLFPLIGAGFSLMVSSIPAVGKMCGNFFGNAQFAFRFVAYVNLFLLTGCLVSCRNIKMLASRRLDAVMGGAFVLIVLTIFLKVYNPFIANPSALLGSERAEKYQWSRLNSVALPRSFYWTTNYLTPDLFDSEPGNPPESVSAILPVEDTNRFGETGEIQVKCLSNCKITTNIAAFYWNHPVVRSTGSNRALSIRTSVKENFIVFEAGPGDYTISYSFNPPVLWNIARQATCYLLILASIFLLGMMAVRRVSNSGNG